MRRRMMNQTFGSISRSAIQRGLAVLIERYAIALVVAATVMLTGSVVLAQSENLVGKAVSPSTNSEISLEQSQIDRRVREALRQHVRQMLDGLSPEAKSGYHNLVDKIYLPPDFNEEVLTELEKNDFVSPLQSSGLEKESSWEEKRATMLKAFGIAHRPDDPSKPLQYVVDKEGQWVMNCFACHGGSTYGVVVPGAPNTTYSLETFTEQVRRAKLRLKIPLTHMDIGSVFMPLGTSVGTSNAVMFGVALMNYRDADLNIHKFRPPASMVHHDMDAPPWWHFKRKTHMYIDGFAEKGHKGLMQFMLVKENGPDKFRKWEKDFAQVYQFLSEVKSPVYPLQIETQKAERGRAIFSANCASCHGTYEQDNRSYPEMNVAIEDVKTDKIRHASLTPTHRKHYGKSWFAEYGEQSTFENPEGYTAPPLDGIWVSAPYLHNGSVPTLEALLNPDSRPTVWRRTSESYNEREVGFKYEALNELPEGFEKLPNYDRHWYFDSRQEGKSNQGHDYPSKLTQDEKSDLLEYLKTL